MWIQRLNRFLLILWFSYYYSLKFCWNTVRHLEYNKEPQTSISFGQRCTEAAGCSLVSIIIDHIFLCIKDAGEGHWRISKNVIHSAIMNLRHTIILFFRLPTWTFDAVTLFLKGKTFFHFQFLWLILNNFLFKSYFLERKVYSWICLIWYKT